MQLNLKTKKQSCALSTWIVHNMCGNSLWCHICRYGDFLSSVGNLGWKQTIQSSITHSETQLNSTKGRHWAWDRKASSRLPPSQLIINIHTTFGNSSLTRDMMREVFPTLAVEGGREKRVKIRLTVLLTLANTPPHLLANPLQFTLIFKLWRHHLLILHENNCHWA